MEEHGNITLVSKVKFQEGMLKDKEDSLRKVLLLLENYQDNLRAHIYIKFFCSISGCGHVLNFGNSLENV